MATVNYVLQKIAEDMFIKYGSEERAYIEERIKNFKISLKDHFQDAISDVVLFGSFKRDTILPRKFDEASDIDVLVVFDQSSTEYTPETYRNQLRRFAKTKYFSSNVVKDHPSIVLEMKSIKFDLVPCRVNRFLYDTYEIPDKYSSWMETDPKGFNDKLSGINMRSKYIVKPIIRLMKRWNAYENYPYYPFELEKILAELNFSGDNYERGFIYACENISTYDLPDYQKKKVETLRGKIAWVKEYLDRDNQEKASEVVRKILGLKQ